MVWCGRIGCCFRCCDVFHPLGWCFSASWHLSLGQMEERLLGVAAAVPTNLARGCALPHAWILLPYMPGFDIPSIKRTSKYIIFFAPACCELSLFLEVVPCFFVPYGTGYVYGPVTSMAFLVLPALAEWYCPRLSAVVLFLSLLRAPNLKLPPRR